ncbi:MAG: PAS domain S-box protein [Deltaproteobacteria bacterium]|nr:PAS domain S-box protein [Deltaproteobacteria bacterium]
MASGVPVIIVACAVVIIVLSGMMLILRRSTARLQNQINFWHDLLERTTAGIVIVSPERQIIEVNRRLCEMYGYSRDELIGQSAEIFHLDRAQFERFRQWFDNARNEGPLVQIEYQYRRKDGSTFWAVISGGALMLPDGNMGVVWSLTDISDKKQTEAELATERSHMQTLFEVNGSGMLVVSSTRQILQVNRQFCNLFGYSREELVGQSARVLHVDQQHYEAWAPRFQEAKAGFPIASADYPWRRKDGSVFWCFFAGVKMQLPSGESGVLWNVIDITERKKMEEQLYLMLYSINAANEGVFLADENAAIRFVNDGACRRLGYTREEFLSMRVFDIDPLSPAEKWPEHWQYLMTHGARTIETVHRAKNGTEFPVEVSISSVAYNGISYVCGLARDITERIRAEEEKTKLESQLRQSQKMEAIGTLAGGIAHDFNNILAVILGYAELTLRETLETDPRRSKLGEIIKASIRAKELVRQILDFSRKAERTKKPLLMAPFLKETLKMVRASIPSTIVIKERISAVDSTVLGDQSQLHQVIINLCTNAFHAMEEQGGILSITLDYVQLGREEAAGLGGGEGRYVRLIVADSGCGMSLDIQNRIFEPYFTTKGVGKGSGMGLAVVHGILRSHGGLMRLTSQEGKGSSFEVFLPAIEQPVMGKVEEEERFCPPGTERILVVDDEPAITEMVSQWLGRLGYAVTTSNNSAKALTMVRENPSGFDLIVTDQSMPFMPGSELAKEILSSRPDLPIILCTGYSAILSEEKAMEIGIKRYAYKPLQGDELARLVRQVLDDGKGG